MDLFVVSIFSEKILVKLLTTPLLVSLSASTKMTTPGYHCAVTSCTSGGYQLQKWREATCPEHHCIREEDGCTCPEPLRYIYINI